MDLSSWQCVKKNFSAAPVRRPLDVNSLVELVVASVAVLGLVLLGEAGVEGRRLDLRRVEKVRGWVSSSAEGGGEKKKENGALPAVAERLPPKRL